MNISELKVLIVEDNPNKYSDIANALEKCGVRNMESASNLEEAFGMIKDSPFDLIITDMQYPLSGGLAPEVDNAGEQLINHLKEKSINIPVIVCSSINYVIPDVLGCVWYSERTVLDQEFRRFLEKLKNLPL